MFCVVLFAMLNQAALELPVLRNHTLGSGPRNDFSGVGRREHIIHIWGIISAHVQCVIMALLL